MANLLTCPANNENLPLLDETSFDLYGMLAKFEQQLDLVAKSRGLFLGVNIYEDTSRYLYGDSMRLNTILNNLAEYIISHLTDGGIFLNVNSTPIDETRCRIDMIFTDTGLGIPGYKLKTIYQPVYKMSGYDHAYKKTPSLYIAKILTSLMGGDVNVQTSFGWGTRYSAHVIMKTEMPKYNHYN